MGVPSESAQAAALKQYVESKSASERQEMLALAPLPPDASQRGLSRMGGGGNVSLTDGTGMPYGARVTPDNNVGVEARYESIEPASTHVVVGTSSMELVAAAERRRQVTVQNVHPTHKLYIHLDGTAVAGEDLMLVPGAMFSLPPGVAYTGSISGVASDIDTDVVVLEFKAPETA